MAQNPGHRLAYRVHFTAIGWADRQGHAGFGPGRLATLLGKDGKSMRCHSMNGAASPSYSSRLICVPSP